MNPDQSTQTVIYNRRFTILAPLVVTEKLQWDGVLKKNVWAHPTLVCTLTDALKRVYQETEK